MMGQRHHASSFTFCGAPLFARPEAPCVLTQHAFSPPFRKWWPAGKLPRTYTCRVCKSVKTPLLLRSHDQRKAGRHDRLLWPGRPQWLVAQQSLSFDVLLATCFGYGSKMHIYTKTRTQTHTNKYLHKLWRMCVRRCPPSHILIYLCRNTWKPYTCECVFRHRANWMSCDSCCASNLCLVPIVYICSER